MLAKLITLQNTSLGQCSLFSFFIFFYLYSLNNATEFNSVGTIKTTVHNVPQKYASCFVIEHYSLLLLSCPNLLKMLHQATRA